MSPVLLVLYTRFSTYCFLKEIDHEAESLISDLFISYDDTPIDSGQASFWNIVH